MSPMNRLHSGSDTTLFNLQAMACLLIGLCIADVARLNGITSPTLGSAALLINGAICVSIALHFFPRLIGLGAGSLSLHALLGGLLLVLFKQHRLDAPALATLGSTTSPGLIYEALAIGALGVTAAWLHWRGLLRWRATLGFLFTSLAYQLLTKSPEPNAVIMHGIALALMPHLFATLQTTPAHPRGTWLLGAVGGLSYTLLCAVYSPLFALCIATLVGGLARPMILLVTRTRLLVFGATASTLLAAIATIGIAAHGLTPLTLTLPVLVLLAGLSLSSVIAALYTRLIKPRQWRHSRDRLQAQHEALAARGEVVLRARVTGALHRTPEKE